MKNIRLMIILFFFYSIANATVRIGTPIYDPAYTVNYPVSGVAGFDIDYMKKICERLRWDCQFVPLKDFDILSALQKDTIDFGMGSIVITPEKQKNFAFSIPYLGSAAAFLVSINSPIKTIADLKGKKVGVVTDTAYIDYLQRNFSNQVTIVPFALFTPLALDLRSGKIDAAFMNYMSALYVEHQNPDKIKIIPIQFKVGAGLGIVTLPANKEKLEPINHVIQEFQTDGTFLDLYNDNFLFFARDPAH